MKIGVMGNIGAGKTTLCSILKKEFDKRGLDFEVEYESQDESPYMEDYYNDMNRWAFNSQIFFLRRKFESDIKTANTNKNFIIDRIIDEDVFVFASMLHDSGYIDERDWQNYLDVFELMKPHITKYDMIIYLYSSVENVVKNIMKRNRNYEKQISIDYINKLEEKYEELSNKLKSEGNKIIKIYCDDLDFEHDNDDLEYLLEKLGI